MIWETKTLTFKYPRNATELTVDAAYQTNIDIIENNGGVIKNITSYITSGKVAVTIIYIKVKIS